MRMLLLREGECILAGAVILIISSNHASSELWLDARMTIGWNVASSSWLFP